MFQVKKKDGTLESFDRNKIINGVLKSGATNEEAEKIAVEIEAWLPTKAVNGIIDVLDVRAKVLEVLKTLNPTAGAAFEAYTKPVQEPTPTMPPTAPPTM